MTILGLVLRLLDLSYPCLWYDECMTFSRVGGSYHDLLNVLQYDGFAPLHYELYWLMARVCYLTPFAMRVVPAIAGTLMIPAIYFLGRQLVDRRTACLAAVITAFSAYMLAYSRDAKMYMEFWLLVTLNVGCLLGWLRTNRRLSWLLWIMTGIGMVGLHALGLALLPIELLMFATYGRFRWIRLIGLIAGLALILAGPAGYYLGFNQWRQQINDRGWNGGSHLFWVNDYNAGRSGGDLLLYTGSAYLVAWEWPKNPAAAARIAPDVRAALQSVSVVLAGSLMLGTLPWPRRFRGHRAILPHSRFRILLWLTLWIALPLYTCYCLSIPSAISPLGMLAMRQIVMPAVLVIAAVGILFSAFSARTITSIFLSCLTPLALLALAQGIHAATRNHFVGSLWTPRYLGFIWPALAILSAVLIMRLPGKTFQMALVGLFVAANLTQFAARLTAGTEPPIDRVAADVLAGQSPGNATQTFTGPVNAGSIGPARGSVFDEQGQYYFCLLTGRTPTPQAFRDTTQNAGMFHTLTDRTSVLRAVHDSPRLKRLILWNAVPNGKTALTLSLGNDWKLVDTAGYVVRDPWTWETLYTYQRAEFMAEISTNIEKEPPVRP